MVYAVLIRHAEFVNPSPETIKLAGVDTYDQLFDFFTKITCIYRVYKIYAGVLEGEDVYILVPFTKDVHALVHNINGQFWCTQLGIKNIPQPLCGDILMFKERDGQLFDIDLTRNSYLFDLLKPR